MFSANVKNGVVYLQFQPEHEQEIINACSYEMANSFWIQKHCSWSGVVDLYSKKTKSFPLGLLERVEAIEGKKFDVKFLDLVQKISVPQNSFFDSMEERDYQTQAVEKAVLKGIGIVNLATGGGKTLIGCEIIRRLGVRSIVFVPTKTLLLQWHRELQKLFGGEIGIVGDGQKLVRPITVCTVQSAEKELVQNFNLAIFDETHRLGARKWRKVSKMCNARYRFGLSATALLREDGANLEIVGICGEVLQDIRAKELQDKGYLVNCSVEFVFVPFCGEFFDNFTDAVELQIVQNNERHQLVLQKIRELEFEGRKVLVLLDRIEHGRILAEMGNYQFISGADSGETRMKAIQDLEEGKIRVLVTTKVFELGVDIPVVDGLVVASPAMSVIKVIQRIGRGLRKAIGKKELRVIDFVDNCKYFKRQARKRQEIYGKEGFG